MKTCLPLILGFVLLVFSTANANITWSTDNFDYSAKDSVGIYLSSSGAVPVLLSASSQKSAGNGDVENTDVAAATEPPQGASAPGLSMSSAAWGNSFQNADKDSGGATAYVYADGSYALDSPAGVFQNGQRVTSYIDRPFTVSATGNYTLSASALIPLDWSGTTSGKATAPQPQFTGEVQIYQTDPKNNTTTLLDSETFSLSNLALSPRQMTLSLVKGDNYQLVVAIAGVSSTGGESGQPGVTTSFNNLDSSFSSVGNIDGNFNAGTQTTPVLITASLAPTPSLWQNATPTGNDWYSLSWFGAFYESSAQWIYHQWHGWLFPIGTTTDDIWFWDQAMTTFWWTSRTAYPYVYRVSDQAWLYYDVGTSNPRWFFNYATQKWESDN
jgi:hypothetical protein